MGIDSEQIWRELHGGLRNYIRRRVATDSDADDLLQDVFARIQASARQATEVESISGWVYRITRNVITDYHRARARAADATSRLAQTVDEGGMAIGDGDDFGDDTEPRAELARCLRPLVDQLPEQYGDAVALTDLGGMPQVEAAERMGLSTSGMKSRVQRGRAKLKDLLLDCCEVELDSRKGVVDYEPRNKKDGEDYGCC